MPKPVSQPLRERASCATCDFAGRHDNNDALRFCRRRPPTVLSNQAVAWPTVKATDFCGEYRSDQG